LQQTGILFVGETMRIIVLADVFVPAVLVLHQVLIRLLAISMTSFKHKINL